MKSILIIDDDQFMANVCRRKFEDSSFQVVVAHDGHAAIEELVLHPPDVVLLDLVLPEIDGLGVLRFLRSRDRLRGLPVIVVSNSTYFSGLAQAAWHAGATHFFNKGDCSPRTLVDEANKALARKETPAATEAAPRTGPPPLPPSKNPPAPTGPPPPEPAAVEPEPAPVESEPAPVERKPAAVERKPGGPCRVIVADDDRVVRGVLEFFLKQAGFIAVPCGNGREALELAEAQPPDLLVLDGMMPELDGFETLKRWKQTPALARIPVIMLTADKDEGKKTEALGRGAEAYLIKPFSPDDLVVRVKQLIDATS